MIFVAECVTILWQSGMIAYALLAQLDRVFGYEPKGQGFESLAARQPQFLVNQGVAVFFMPEIFTANLRFSNKFLTFIFNSPVNGTRTLRG